MLAAAAAAVLVDLAVHGVLTTRAAATGPVATGPWWAVAAGVALLTATGALPAWRLAGGRPLAVFLAPCLGALVAAVSAVVTVVGSSEPLRWYVAFAAAANAAALASVAGREHHRRRPTAGPAVLVAVVLVAVGFGAAVLGRVGPGPVADATWEPLARVLVHGHAAVRPALEPSSTAVRLLSSPLGAGTASVTWLVTGATSGAVARGVLLVLTAAAVGAAACAVVEAGGAAGTGRSPAVRLVAATAGIAFCLAAFGVAGPAAAGGDLTLLWAAAATGAAVLCLVLEPTGWHLRAGMVLGAVATLAGPPGVTAAAVLVVAVALRRVVGVSGRGRGALRLVDLTGGLVSLAAVAAWPVAAFFSGVGPPSAALPPSGGLARVGDAWRSVASPMWPLVPAAAVAVVAAVVVGRHRRRAGLAGDAGPALVAAVVVAAQLAAVGWDTGVSLPLRLEPHRLVAALPLLVASALMAVWAPVALAATGRAARGSAPEGTAEARVDGPWTGVLHPSP